MKTIDEERNGEFILYPTNSLHIIELWTVIKIY